MTGNLGIGMEAESTVLFDPPFDSPIEEMFAWDAVKFLDPAARFEKQVSVVTSAGRFRMDFLATNANGRRVAFECDGKNWHDEFRDECRDAMILWSGGADVVYRCRGSDIFYHPNELLYLIASFEPSLFSAHGIQCLARLTRDSHPRMRMIAGLAWIEFPGNEYGDPSHILELHIHARVSREVQVGPGVFLRDFYDYAVRRGGDLDDVMNAWLQNEDLE